MRRQGETRKAGLLTTTPDRTAEIAAESGGLCGYVVAAEA